MVIFTVQAVWNKARIIYGTDPAVRRKDLCGAIIDRSAYGNTAEKALAGRSIN